MDKKASILIVDDEKIVCDMAKRSFEAEGHDVTVFTDSTDALAVLKEKFFDILITDLKMKEVDGLQLLDFVQQNCPETKVIIFTAFGTPETAIDAFHKQAFDYFTKPVRIKDLIASVSRALDTSNFNMGVKNNG